MAHPSTGTRSGWTSTSSRPERIHRRNPRPYRPRVLRDSGISPAKALGQHFLTDQGIVNRIVAAAELTTEDTVIEVGPGLGVLTERLVEVAGRVIAVELDARLAERLVETLAARRANLKIIQEDILSVSPVEMLIRASGATSPPGPLSFEGEREDERSPSSVGPVRSKPYVVVANLPYNIGAAVLRHFLEAAQPPRRLVVMLQREVADSICAMPGDLSLLGVSVQVYAEPRRLFAVPARAFYPPPKVTSSVIRLDVREEPLVPLGERDAFFAIVRAGFSAPRKQLANSLAQGLRRPIVAVRDAIAAANVDPSLRPQSLQIEDWRRLTTILQERA